MTKVIVCVISGIILGITLAVSVQYIVILNRRVSAIENFLIQAQQKQRPPVNRGTDIPPTQEKVQ